MAENDEALGIPDRSHFGNIQDLSPGEILDMVIQKHDAKRAGSHYDFRIGSQDHGLFSWATRKGLPKPGTSRILFRQPLHRHSYKDFQGEIPEGEYGAGKVRKYNSGKVLVTSVSPKAVRFTVADTRYPEKFLMVNIDGRKGNWLVTNETKKGEPPASKVKYKSVSPEKADEEIAKMEPGSSVQPKVDGALGIITIDNGKYRIFSHRKSKVTKGPIEHTDRVLGGVYTNKVPDSLNGTILKGEIYGKRRGKSIEAQDLGGILNSSVVKSLKKQKDKRINISTLLFDVEKYQGRDTRGLPYSERRKILQRIIRTLPGDKFELPEEATVPDDARRMMNKIRLGLNPLTNEGVIIHPPSGPPKKVKFTSEHDVYVRNIFQGTGKYSDAAGGFEYSLEPEGPIVGKVGTGLSDDLRKDMWYNQEDYIGRTAKIHAQQQHTSGAFRAPSLIAMHEDY